MGISTLVFHPEMEFDMTNHTWDTRNPIANQLWQPIKAPLKG